MIAWLRRPSTLLSLAGLILGGALGWLYWHEIGCNNGTCMIWSNPWISTAYGALLGYFLVGLIPVRKSKKAAGAVSPPPSENTP